MNQKLETLRYSFSVEGVTEKLYLDWLESKINEYPDREYNVSISSKVYQSPKKFAKIINRITTPEAIHLCDIEGVEKDQTVKFHGILSEIKDIAKEKRIKYNVGYSNFTFELWMILHKTHCFAPLSNKGQYLSFINRAYKTNFETLADYKENNNFNRCLMSLTLNDVFSAVKRAKAIMEGNKRNGLHQIEYKGFKYFPDNPSLSIYESIEKILKECGVNITV